MGFSWKLHLKKLGQAYRQCNKSETSDQAGQAPEPKARNKNTLRFFLPTAVNRLYVLLSIKPRFLESDLATITFQIDLLAAALRLDVNFRVSNLICLFDDMKFTLLLSDYFLPLSTLWRDKVFVSKQYPA